MFSPEIIPGMHVHTLCILCIYIDTMHVTCILLVASVLGTSYVQYVLYNSMSNICTQIFNIVYECTDVILHNIQMVTF